METRRINEDGSKRVHQYRTLNAQWNPYALGAEEGFKALWELGDLWVVEGIFDKISLDKVIPSCDACISTLRAGMDAITMDMIERFYTPASTIYICYDNDETGQKKSYWLQREMKKRGMRAVIWKYRGKDPNDVWTQGGDQALRRMFL
jgi:DNA primase